MKKRWWYFLLYIFLLPHTLVGLLMASVYWPTKVRWSDGCLEMVAGSKKDGTTRIFGKPGAQTWGFLIYYANEECMNRSDLRVHERCHVVQACVLLGVPFVILYVGDFCARLIWVDFEATKHFVNSPRWYKAYRSIWFEKQAYDRQWKSRAKELPFKAWGSYAKVLPINAIPKRQ